MKEIPLTHKGEIFMVYIDDEDQDLFEVPWHLHGNRGKNLYVQRNVPDDRIPGNRKLEFLHVIILERKLGRKIVTEYTDHKDRNPLNNTRENIRESTRSQNLANTLGNRNATYPHGVYAHKKKFWTKITFQGRQEYIGIYDTIEEASAAFQKRHAEVHGEFSPYYKEGSI